MEKTHFCFNEFPLAPKITPTGCHIPDKTTSALNIKVRANNLTLTHGKYAFLKQCLTLNSVFFFLFFPARHHIGKTPCGD